MLEQTPLTTAQEDFLEALRQDIAGGDLAGARTKLYGDTVESAPCVSHEVGEMLVYGFRDFEGDSWYGETREGFSMLCMRHNLPEFFREVLEAGHPDAVRTRPMDTRNDWLAVLCTSHDPVVSLLQTKTLGASCTLEFHKFSDVIPFAVIGLACRPDDRAWQIDAKDNPEASALVTEARMRLRMLEVERAAGAASAALPAAPVAAHRARRAV